MVKNEFAVRNKSNLTFHILRLSHNLKDHVMAIFGIFSYLRIVISYQTCEMLNSNLITFKKNSNRKHNRKKRKEKEEKVN